MSASQQPTSTAAAAPNSSTGSASFGAAALVAVADKKLIRNLRYHESEPAAPKTAQATTADVPDAEPVPDKTISPGHEYHSLDLYLPTPSPGADPAAKVPVLIHVHGGGWQRGDRTSEWRGAPLVGRTASAAGFVVAVVSYRLAPPSVGVTVSRAILAGFLLSLFMLLVPDSDSPFDSHWVLVALCAVSLSILLGAILFYKAASDTVKARHPHQVTDVARAIAWVSRNIQRYAPTADLDSVFVSGHSAGAHLASLVTLDHRYLIAAGVPKPEVFIKGCIPMSGIYTVANPMSCKLTNAMFRSMYAISAFGSDPEVWKQASPISYVSAERTTIPFCVMNASQDLGLEADGKRFVEKLKSVGIACEYHVLPCTTHASIASSFNKCDAHKLYFSFVSTRVAQLKAKSSTPVAVTPTTNPAAGAAGALPPAVISLSDVDIKLDSSGKKDL